MRAVSGAGSGLDGRGGELFVVEDLGVTVALPGGRVSLEPLLLLLGFLGVAHNTEAVTEAEARSFQGSSAATRQTPNGVCGESCEGGCRVTSSAASSPSGPTLWTSTAMSRPLS